MLPSGGPLQRWYSSSPSGQTKLKKAKNAWRPSFHEANVEDEAAKTAEVKKIWAILNELTQRELGIGSIERLSEVVDLIFEKAVDE